MATHQVLLVEGSDDCHVCWNLFERHGVAENFKVKDKEGISKLLDQLDVELLASDLETLGIMVDADTNIAARWQSLSHRLQNCGYPPLPAVPDPQGTIIESEGLPKVGIWVMPDNQINGMLEDFIAFLIPADDALWPYAQKCVEDIDPIQRSFGSHVIKANVHTWLAWQEHPGTPLGSAIKYCYLKDNVPQALAFVDWVKRLFAK